MKSSPWLIAVQFVQAAPAEGRDNHCIQNAPDPLENPRTEWIQRMNRKYAAPFSLEPQPYPDFGIELHRPATMSAGIELCPADRPDGRRKSRVGILRTRDRIKAEMVPISYHRRADGLMKGPRGAPVCHPQSTVALLACAISRVDYVVSAVSCLM